MNSTKTGCPYGRNEGGETRVDEKEQEERLKRFNKEVIRIVLIIFISAVTAAAVTLLATRPAGL